MKFIKNILFLSIFSTICFSAKFQKILSGENYTKIRFKQIEIDQKTEIENSSFFYQYNGEISINLDSFDYEIENGESSSIPNPNIQIIEFGYIRGFKIFKIEISSSTEIENSKIKFDNIEFTIEELNFNTDEIESRIHSPIFEKFISHYF